VFTTAYDEYAINAFDAEAVAYLLKPIRRERLLKALARAAKTSRLRAADWRENRADRARESIPVTQGGRITRVEVGKVISFHADQKYVRMTHATGEALIDESLVSLEQEFADSFVRIHRNSLVRLDAIASCETDGAGQLCVRLRGSAASHPVSRRHAARVRQLLRDS
jgi:two-component system response regulator AlgR